MAFCSRTVSAVAWGSLPYGSVDCKLLCCTLTDRPSSSLAGELVSAWPGGFPSCTTPSTPHNCSTRPAFSFTSWFFLISYVAAVSGIFHIASEPPAVSAPIRAVFSFGLTPGRRDRCFTNTRDTPWQLNREHHGTFNPDMPAAATRLWRRHVDQQGISDDLSHVQLPLSALAVTVLTPSRPKRISVLAGSRLISPTRLRLPQRLGPCTSPPRIH